MLNEIPWVWFGVAVGVLIIIGIVVYILLARWYKLKYEKYLFPNTNDLFNIAVFIENGKRAGKNNTEIESNLKRAGWSGEQVKYAMKKYYGKQTGLWGFGGNSLPKKQPDKTPSRKFR